MRLFQKFLIPIFALAMIGGCNKAIAPQAELEKLPYRPMRIVSINPCADAILIEVTDKSQIKAISHYSHDKRGTSIDLAIAKQFPRTFDTAEEIISFQPDLVIAGSHVALPTINALQRLKIPILTLKVPATIEESKQQITKVADITGNHNRGIILNNKIDDAVKLAQSNETKGAITKGAIIWQGNGLVPGGGTLADELLKTAGFKNKSTEYGLSQWDILPLEPLINDPPEYIFTDLEADRTDRILNHPIIKKANNKMQDGKTIKIRDFRPKYLSCAGPVMIDTLKRLHEVSTEEGQ